MSSLGRLSDDARRLWRAATALNRAAAAVSPTAAGLPPLLFFTDPERTPEPWATAARLPVGAAVVYRGFGAADAEAMAQRLRQVTTEAGVRLLIGMDADLAERVGADGVHLPERALDRAALLARQRPDWLITGAAHGVLREAAEAEGLRALVVSPVFPPGGASASRPSLGLEGFRTRAGSAPCPVYALGGIAAETAEMLMGSGACGIAGVASIQAAFGGIRT